MRTLVAGWFSFKEGHATAGDILARDLACQWLEHAGHTCDIAVAPPFTGGVDWRLADPQCYSHVLFVCGPFEKKPLESEFLKKFRNCRLIGLNLSMFEPLEKWNPFDYLFERDSSLRVSPDIVFLSQKDSVPVVGVCLVEHYENALVDAANSAIQRLISSQEVAAVNIDTRLDINSTNLSSPAEIESLISRMDMVVTTRLHGTVLALKNGIPAIAIDPVSGGHKIKRQAGLIGWPVVFTADALADHALRDAFEYCMTEDARNKAAVCRDRAVKMALELRDKFIAAMAESNRNADSHFPRAPDAGIKNSDQES